MLGTFVRISCVAAALAAAPAFSQPHDHVIPGHLHRHGGHFDYHPPQVIHHHPTYVSPSPSYPQPTVYNPPYYPPGVVSPSQPYQTVQAPAAPYVAQRPVNPGSIGHVDDVAVDLERAANQMCMEMYYNYRQNRGWDETYREAYEILNTAKEIHAMEHGGDRDRMRQAATRIDGLFHHVQDDVRHWARYGSQYIGPGGLRARMDEVEDALHHLMEDIGAAPEDVQQHGRPAGGFPPPAGSALPSGAAPPAAPGGVPYSGPYPQPSPSGSAIGPPPSAVPPVSPY